MKILMVCDYLSGDIEGGSDRIFYEYAKGLKERNHSVSTAAAGGGNRLLRFFQAVLGPRRLYGKLSRNGTLDVINFHQPLSAFLILLSKRAKESLRVYTFHSPWHMEYEISNRAKGVLCAVNSFFRKHMERFCLSKCDRIITLSEYMKKEAVKIHNIKPGKITVIPGGVDTERFRPPSSKAEARRRLSLPEDKFIILTVRNFTRRTGLIELIKACRGILEREGNIILVIVGDGPLKGEMEAVIDRYRLKSGIIITGFVPNGLLPSYYQASDLFVMPTQKLEGFGLALVEALSSGLPVLATPVGGITEVLSGMDKDAFFKDISQDSLSEGLKRLINDTEARERMAAKARDYARERYSWNNVIPRLEKAFQR